MNSYRFGVFWIKKLPDLISCMEKGAFGLPSKTIELKNTYMPPELMSLKVDDRVFLTFQKKILCGPFIVTNPPTEFKIVQSRVSWHKINIELTPSKFLPIWILDFPWVIFFDPMLASQVNYCQFSGLQRAKFQLPPWGGISQEEGKRLWEFVESNGNSFAEFIQRHGLKQGIKVRLSAPSSRSEKVFSKKYKTIRGLSVRSRGEVMIDDWLHNQKIRAEYERALIFDSELFYPDFYLPDCNLYIEYLGLYDANEEYRQDWDRKESIYKKNGIKYITLLDSELEDLNRYLANKLRSSGVFVS